MFVHVGAQGAERGGGVGEEGGWGGLLGGVACHSTQTILFWSLHQSVNNGIFGITNHGTISLFIIVLNEFLSYFGLYGINGITLF